MAGDDGDLQGATIASYVLTVDTGITKDTDNKDAVDIKKELGSTTVISWSQYGC